MRRFFFNVHDGKSELDRVGTELPDKDEALRKAIEIASRILTDEKASLTESKSWQIEVKDAVGSPIFRLNFSATVPPAGSHVSRH